MKNPLKYLWFLFVLPTIVSCKHKDLYAEVPHTLDIEVVFDWRNAPDGNPQSMALYLYDREGGKPIRYIFTGRDGGKIRVPYGTYDALCMNGDGNDWALVRDAEDIETFEIYTHDANYLEAYGLNIPEIPRAGGTEDERMASTPGMLWDDRGDGFQVKVTDTKKVLTLYPEEAVCHYVVDVYDVENAEYINGTSLDATLSGVAEGFVNGQKHPSDEHVTMPFVLNLSADRKSLHSEFLTFGQSHSPAHTNIMSIYLYLSDGSKMCYTFDTTRQVDSATDPHHVHIVVNGLKLPKQIVNGGGLIPSVNDWITEHIDLNM